MPYLKAIETDTLTLPSSTAETTNSVVMKQRATHGDRRAAQSAMLKIDTATISVSEMELGVYADTLAIRLIVSWSLTDENDQPLPVTVESLQKLSPEDGEFLSTEANKRGEIKAARNG